MHPDHEVLVLQLSGDASQEEKDAFNRTMDAIQEVMLEDQQQIAQTLNISLHTAGLVQYLRGRSRWTQEKENELVRLDQAGEELPNVLAGEF